MVESRINILIVDDQPRNLIALAAALESTNYSVLTAASGADALELVLEQEFAVIVLDIHMPEMDGFETASLIRMREKSQSTPIIFLTADDRRGARVLEGYRLGAVDYLYKPFDPVILRSKVDVFVELFRKTAALEQRTAELIATTLQLDRARAAADLRHQALHDGLTGLPNRVLLYERLESEINSPIGEQARCALLLLDLDRFKEVNDTLGHQVGDALLQQLGQRLQTAMLGRRPGGSPRRRRIRRAAAAHRRRSCGRGGRRSRARPADTLRAGRSVHRGGRQHRHRGRPAARSGRGYAVAPRGRRHVPGQALRHRRGHVYAATGTSTGRIGWRCSASCARPSNTTSCSCTTSPSWTCATARWSASRRWCAGSTRNAGFLPPSEFIPLAEQSGLIHPLSRWVLDAALRQQQAWRAIGLDVPVAVNLSRRMLHDPHLPETVAQLLAAAGTCRPRRWCWRSPRAA